MKKRDTINTEEKLPTYAEATTGNAKSEQLSGQAPASMPASFGAHHDAPEGRDDFEHSVWRKAQPIVFRERFAKKEDAE